MSSYNRTSTSNNHNNHGRNNSSSSEGERGQRYIPRDDHRSKAVTHPSICIPRTFTTIRGEQTKRAVFNTFKDLRVGHIERIDTVHKTDNRGERYCTVYVHLKWNMESKLACDTRQKLLDGQDVKIVYDEPWFWKCTMSTMEKPESRFPEKQERTTSRPRIDLGEGTRAVSRYSRDEPQDRERRDGEPNRGQLCNMGSEEECE